MWASRITAKYGPHDLSRSSPNISTQWTNTHILKTLYTCNTELSNGIRYLSAVQTQNTVATFAPAAVVMEAAVEETAVVDDDVAVAAAVDFEKPG